MPKLTQIQLDALSAMCNVMPTDAFAQLVRASDDAGDDAEMRLAARLQAFELGLRWGSRKRTQTPAPALPTFERAGQGGAVFPPLLPVGQGRSRTQANWPTGRRLPRGSVPRVRSKEQQLHDAIDDRRVVSFSYKGRPRIVEPHVLGIKDGRLHVLTWQTGGASSGRLPGWRRFDVDLIADLEQTGDSFPGSRAAYGRPSPFDRQVAVVR